MFSFLTKEYLEDFYSSDESVLWNNYMVFAIDGSKAEVPNIAAKEILQDTPIFIIFDK